MLSEAEHISRLQNEQQMIHRLRDWSDGDLLYGVRSYNAAGGYTASSGKTFQDEGRARSQFNSSPVFGNEDDFDVILFKAVIRDPKRDSADPYDPGEPPSTYATLENVEILDRKPPQLD